MDIRAEAMKLFEKNRRETDGFEYTVPSADHYPYQWLWDSCFHAIILSKYDPDAARAEIRSLLTRQFDSGLVPHIIYWVPGVLHRFPWGVEGTSSLTQPPMIANAVWEIHGRDPDSNFLQDVFPSLVAFYQYLLTERDVHGHGLAAIVNPDESGEDNSPRFDEPLGVPYDITIPQHLAKRTELVEKLRECAFDCRSMRDHFSVEDVLFNAILAENVRTMAKISALLGDVEREHSYIRISEDIGSVMRERMFEDGVFWSVAGDASVKQRVATWGHFMPLFAGLYSQEEAEALVAEHFRNDETFRAPFGIRTVSRRESSYTARDTDFSWRGPVWIGAHWFMYRGLMRYGFREDAAWLRDRSIALLEQSGFRECFDPETGEGIGAHGFTWGALTLDMME